MSKMQKKGSSTKCLLSETNFMFLESFVQDHPKTRCESRWNPGPGNNQNNTRLWPTRVLVVKKKILNVYFRTRSLMTTIMDREPMAWEHEKFTTVFYCTYIFYVFFSPRMDWRRFIASWTPLLLLLVLDKGHRHGVSAQTSMNFYRKIIIPPSVFQEGHGNL